MKVSREMENLLLNANLKTNMNILVTDDKSIVYYIGDSKDCGKYLYSEISENLKDLIINLEKINFLKEDDCICIVQNDSKRYYSQCVCKFCKNGEFSKCIVFYKSDSDFNEEEIFIINSMTYLIEKYFN